MNHDPFKINEAILDLWRDLKACEEYIHDLEIRNASLVSERERIELELEQRCRELNLSLAQQAIQLKQIEELKAEVERLTNENGNNSVMKKEWYLKCMSARAEVESVRQVAQDNKTETEVARIKNDRLKAEVERLKSLCDNLGMGGKHTVTAIVEENASLKAEVERLRKAGDAVSLCLEAFWKGKPYDTSTNIKCFDAWNAAKEGKPSV